MKIRTTGRSGRLPASRAAHIAVALFTLAWVLGPEPASAAPITTVEILPLPKIAVVGDIFSLDLSIANVSDLFDYQFDVTFNPTILQANGISDGGFLTSGGGTSVFSGAFLLMLDNTAGLVTILDSLTGPVTGVTGSGVLARINFSALMPGESAIGLGNVILEDSIGAPIDAETIDGRVQVNPIPEPMTLLLVGSGVAVGLRRARKRRASERDGRTGTTRSIRE